MAHYLADTGPLLRHLRGQRRMVRILSGYGRLGRLGISVVTRMEIRARMQPHERYGTVRFLARFVTYDVNRELADRAGDLVREQAERGRTLSVPDAIIAATAIAHGLTLLTLNTTDFQEIPGLNIASLAEE